MTEGYIRSSTRQALSPDQAQVELAKAARDILLQVASTYRATITYTQLASDVQRRAGVRAGTTPGWLSETLAMVAHVGHRLAEPALTSLVVHREDGRVGADFDEVRRTEGLPPFRDADERESAAAVSRLECYRRFAPGVPEDAAPILVSTDAARRTPSIGAPRAARTAAARASAPRQPARPKPVAPRNPGDVNRAPHVLCPSCFLQTPPGAECQNCGAPLA